MINKFTNFIKEVKVEMQKVSWSTKDELLGSTGVVILSVIIMAIFIGIADFIFAKIVSLVLR